ncbi:hypothetical protein ACFL3V_00390 [Nanoarchaeota archaeon]
MKQKEVVIVVPGVHDISYYPSWIKSLSFFLFRLLRIRPILKDHLTVWKGRIDHGPRTIWMKWTRHADPVSLWLARRKLKRLLRQHKNERVSIVGISMAGDIILDVIKDANPQVSRVILACSVNGHTKIDFPHPRIINIYSDKDRFVQMAIDVYSPFFGGKRLEGKDVKNVVIPNFTHDEFCSDVRIKKGRFKGKRITQLVNGFLKG